MKELLVILFALITSTYAHAGDPNFPLRAVVTREVVKDSQGQSIQLSLVRYQNHNADNEVRIEAVGVPRFSDNANPILGFGRDLDGNGKIDTWFLVTKNGIDLVRKEGNDYAGRDILGELLLSKYRSTLLMYVNSAASSLLSYLFLSVNEGINVQELYFKDWMDLEEMRLRFEDDLQTLGSAYSYAQVQHHYHLLSLGYKGLADRMENFAKRSFWGYAAADIGLWVTGGVVVSWLGKVLAKLGIIASETAFITSVKETVVGFLEKQKTQIQTRLKTVGEKFNTAKAKLGIKVAQKEVATAMTAAVLKQTITRTIKAHKIKQKLRLYVAKTVRVPMNVMKGAKSEWRYITLNTSVQLGSEAFARYDEIYDANPAVMASNLMTNPEVIQNVGFMTTETILMTGVSKNLKTTKAKFLASGAVAVTNSSFVNLALKDDADMTRVAFDTVWESIIGNAQVQIDLMALEHFEKMALKKNNPKIKLVGYAITLVDMGIGYVGYSKATSYLARDEKGQEVETQVMLVPILAEAN